MFAFLPVARRADDMTPVYLEQQEYTKEEYSLILQALEQKGLISLDYEKPLAGEGKGLGAGSADSDSLNLAVFKNQSCHKTFAGLCNKVMLHRATILDKSYCIFLGQVVTAVCGKNGKGTFVMDGPEIVTGPSGSTL